MEQDKLERLAALEEKYPFTFKAPYTGIPKDVNANFVWVPSKAEGYAILMFDDEDDRDEYASRFEDVEPPTELPRRRKKYAAA